MKNRLLIAAHFSLLLIPHPMYAMDNSSTVIYYDQIPFETPELITLEALPTHLQESVTSWVDQNQKLLNDFFILPATAEEYAECINRRKTLKNPDCQPYDCGKVNHVFMSDQAVIKIPGLMNSLCERISALGRDPYEKNVGQTLGGLTAILGHNKSRQQGISRLLAARMIEKLHSPAIRVPSTYAFHLPGKPTALDDRNYLIVEEKLPDNFVSLESLDREKQEQLFEALPFVPLYNGIKYAALWGIKETDLYTDRDSLQEILFGDIEKPNNEAHDQAARWKVAVYGQDKSKWQFDVESHGYQQLKFLIKKYCPKRLEEWQSLKNSDSDFN